MLTFDDPVATIRAQLGLVVGLIDLRCAAASRAASLPDQTVDPAPGRAADGRTDRQ